MEYLSKNLQPSLSTGTRLADERLSASLNAYGTRAAVEVYGLVTFLCRPSTVPILALQHILVFI